MKKEVESMENMKSNYLKEVTIQEELKNVKIENYLGFYSDGRYKFYECSGYFGPQLGHITQKCTKLESLKKNDAIKVFVNRTLIEEIRVTGTVDRILEIMSEKFDRNMGEKTLEMMRKISGEGFKSDESVDRIMDRFRDMII